MMISQYICEVVHAPTPYLTSSKTISPLLTTSCISTIQCTPLQTRWGPLPHACHCWCASRLPMGRSNGDQRKRRDSSCGKWPERSSPRRKRRGQPHPEGQHDKIMSYNNNPDYNQIIMDSNLIMDSGIIY